MPVPSKGAGTGRGAVAGVPAESPVARWLS